MADISSEIERLKNAEYGEEVRDAFISCMRKINEECEGVTLDNLALDYRNSILKLLSGEKEISRVTIAGGSGTGSDAREVELRKSSTAIQWRYAGDSEWTDLVTLAELTGPEGKGDPGEGVPAGGTTGQILTKKSENNYDTQWTDPPSCGSSVEIDSTLTKEGTAADAKATGEKISSLTKDLSQLSEEIDGLKENGINTGNGATTTQANSLWTVLQKIAFTEALTDEELDTFKTAWKISNSAGTDPEATLSSISATYTGGSVAVGTSVNSLTGITVTATYSDGSTTEVTDYTLSGTIAKGSNTITVSYDEKTTTFTVTGVAEDTPEPLYGTYWPPKGAVTDWNNHTWDGVENFAYTGNTGMYIDGGFPEASFIRLDKLQGTLYIRTLTNNQYGVLLNAYKVYANSDGEFSTGGFTEVVPTITRSLGTMVVNDVTYYFVLFKFEIPSGQTGYFTSTQNSANSGYFISDDKIAINEEYKPYYTLFTSNPTDRITEPATEVN